MLFLYGTLLASEAGESNSYGSDGQHAGFLREHNTYFLGKINPRGVRDCEGVPGDFVRPMVQYKSHKGVNNLRRRIESHVSLGQHVVLSDEVFVQVPGLVGELFAGMNISTLDYNIVLVAGYREYHDWIRSSYNYRAAVPKWWEGNWMTWNNVGNKSVVAMACIAPEAEKGHMLVQAMDGELKI